MRQAIHIFKKDLDHLWLEIAVMLALLVALVASELTRWPDLRPLGLAGGLRALLPALISIGWFVLIARVIHAEALVGDRQFWLTRPYSRRSLGAAKAMFALAVLGLPLLLAQATILAGEGFSLRENLAALLRNQTGLLAILLPAAALAAVTADLGKMVIGTLLLYVGILVLQTAIGPMSWIGGVLLLISLVVAAAVVVWLQYSRRRTSVSRLLLGASALLAVVVGAALPSGASSAIQLWLSSERFDAASLHIGLAHRRLNGVSSDAGASVGVPLRLTLPANTHVTLNSIQVSIGAPDGANWKSSSRAYLLDSERPDEPWLVLGVGPEMLVQIGHQAVTLRASLDLTVTLAEEAIPLDSAGPVLERLGFGKCFFESVPIHCEAPFGAPHRVICLKTGPPQSSSSYCWGRSNSSFWPEFSIVPTTNTLNLGRPIPPDARLVIQAAEVARIRKDFELRDLRLADYLIQR